MPEMPLTAGNFGRPRAGLPTTRLVNAYIEATKEGPTGAARLVRPGLVNWNTLGSGPILRQFQQPGLFNGDLFTISGGQLYRNTTLLGSVAYGLQPRMVGANNQLAIVSGGQLYVYNGTSLSTIRFFDDESSPLPPFSGVAVLYDIFIFPVAGSNEFYFSSVGDATTINAANVSAAQVNPDNIVEVTVLSEELLFFKNTSVEYWDYTGELTAPFALSQGRTYIRGCTAQGSVVKLDNAIFWIADDLSVYRTGAVPEIISTPFIDDRIRKAGPSASTATAFYIGIEGHAFYVMNLPSINESYAYDCATKEWAQWGTLTSFDAIPELFAAGCSAGFGESAIYAGSATSNQVWTINAASMLDGATHIQIVVAGAIWLKGGSLRCNNISLACVRGVGNSAASDPLVQMRYSDDGGRTFVPWRAAHLGMVGQYRYKAVWRGLGVIQQPGRLVEFAVADPVTFTVEGATFNEARV